MIRALIVDDEPLSRRALRQLSSAHPDLHIAGECGDGAEAQDALTAMELDVVFLDIQMPAVSGLDVARNRTAQHLPLIVFVTAYDRFAVPAFETDAADYLTKPVTQPRFDATLARVRDRLALIRRAQTESTATSRKDRYLSRLIARVGERDVVIPVNEVDFIEAEDVYAAVHTGGERYLIRTSLDALEQSLDPQAFVRTHRSCIVRVDCITELLRPSPGNREVVLRSGHTVPISRRRRTTVQDILRARPTN